MDWQKELDKHQWQIWRLKGTKQRFVLWDMNFSGDWFALKYADLKRTYNSQRLIRIPWGTLEQKYEFTGDKYK